MKTGWIQHMTAILLAQWFDKFSIKIKPFHILIELSGQSYTYTQNKQSLCICFSSSPIFQCLFHSDTHKILLHILTNPQKTREEMLYSMSRKMESQLNACRGAIFGITRTAQQIRKNKDHKEFSPYYIRYFEM